MTNSELAALQHQHQIEFRKLKVQLEKIAIERDELRAEIEDLHEQLKVRDAKIQQLQEDENTGD